MAGIGKKRFWMLCICATFLLFLGFLLLRVVFAESREGRKKDRWKYIDTHQRHFDNEDFPDGDVLFFAGDFSTKGDVDEILIFNEWMKKFPYPVKLVIAGNHDFSPPKAQDRIFSNEELEQLLTCCSYIHERTAILNPGDIKIYGTSYMANMFKWLEGDRPGFVSYDDKYYFQSERKLFDTYSRIPKDVDILMTHTPPQGILDLDPPNNKGSSTLRQFIDFELTDLSLHLFGHIHVQNGYERKVINKERGGEILFANGAIAPPGTIGWRTDSLVFTFDYYY